MGHPTDRPSCLRLPIIPAIPRKLERKLQKDPSMIGGSKSATSTLPGPPPTRPTRSTDKNSHYDASASTPPDGSTTSGKKNVEEKQIPANTMPAKEDVPMDSDQASQFGVANAELSNAAANPVLPSVLDPQTPPFVPEASRASPEAVDTTSDPKGENNPPPEQHDQQMPYPLHTTGPWMPYHTTPPDDSVHSPVQQSYRSYGQSNPLFYDPTIPYNHPNANTSTYYGHGQYQNLSFHPQSSQSCPSNSPAQSAYEGYAMATTPHVIHSRNDAPSHQHAPSTASRLSNPPLYPSFQPQNQYAQGIPQFSNQLPITPSATPSNSGSQKQEPSQSDVPNHNSAGHKIKAVKNYEKSQTTREISRDYKDWCDRTNITLKEETETSARPVTLLTHLIDNFNSPALADCELYISHVNHRFEPAVVSLHSLLIAQNAKLQDLLQDAEIREDGKKQILLAVADQHTTPAALKIAIKVCYGERPSQYIGFPGELASESDISTAWMNNALALAAAGHLLAMTGVAHRGEQIASIILDWHNLEQALSFAMDTNIRRAWGSSTSTSSFPCNASELLLSCLYFVISNPSESMRIDTTAKPIPSIDRLPTVPDSEAPSTKSRLSQIQFGALPIGPEEAVDKHDLLLSSILLSLPFSHLKFVLDRMPVPINRKVAGPLVAERERRRLRASCIHPSKEERLVESDGEGNGRFNVELVSA
ncbi:MAG: hypothetical protein LQ343_001120 [Gyalolechia ehrenbergii]|nr:MAG: hypothetical protein LQ343_001120 [Gyalolechia ehrenbergii]